MKLLRDSSIGFKVLVPALVLITALGLVSTMAVLGMNQQRQVLQEVNAISLQKMSTIDEFIALAEKVQSDVFHLSVLQLMDVSQDEIEELQGQVDQGFSDLNIIYGQIATKWSLNDQEQEILGRMKLHLDTFRRQGTQAVQVIRNDSSLGVLMVRSSAETYKAFRETQDEFLHYQRSTVLAEEQDSIMKARTLTVAIVSLAVLIAAISTWVTLRIGIKLISRPILGLTETMKSLAGGNLEIEVQDLKRHDEIGAMASAVEVFRNHALQKARMDEALNQALETAARSRRSLIALSQVANAVQRTLDPEELYETVGEELSRLAYETAILTLTDDRRHLSISFLSATPEFVGRAEQVAGSVISDIKFPIVGGSTYHQALFEEETLLQVRPLQALSEALPDPLRTRINRVAHVAAPAVGIASPLTVAGKRLGLLLVSGEHLTEAEIPAVKTLAVQTSTAIENARLNEELRQHAAELEQRVDELDALNSMASVALEASSQSEMLERSLERALEVTESDLGAIVLADAEAGLILDTALMGASETLRRVAQATTFRGSLTELVMASGQPQIFQLDDFPEHARETAVADGIRSVVIVPLLGQQGAVGSINLGYLRPTHIAKQQLNLIVALSQQIAVGIEKARLLEALRESEERYRSLFDNVPVGLFRTGLDGELIEVNEAFLGMMGYSDCRAQLPSSLSELFSDGRDWAEWQARLSSLDVMESVESRWRRQDGTTFWVRMNARPASANGVGKDCYDVYAVDITARKAAQDALRESEARFKGIVERNFDAIVNLDLEGRITYASPSTTRITGRQVDELLGIPFHDLILPEERPKVSLAMAAIQRCMPYEGLQLSARDAHGARYYIEANFTPVFKLDDVIGAQAIFRDFTERKLVEMRLEHLALHDPLTNLPNRRLFKDRLNHAIAQARRTEKLVAVLYLDLDSFKSVNDTLGHEGGDILLERVGRRMRASMRETDTVARFGGDEFSILLENIAQERDVEKAAAKIMASLSRAMSIAGQATNITASMGISLFPRDGLDGESLLRAADRAMYLAKEHGKNQYAFASSDLKMDVN